MLAESHHIRRELARSLHGLSACYLAFKDYSKAWEAAKQSTELYKVDDDLYWLAMQNGANALIGLREISKGITLLERCGLHWQARRDEVAVQSVCEDINVALNRAKVR